MTLYDSTMTSEIAAAGPSEELVASLIESLGQAFDLSTSIGSRTLGEAVADRIRSLAPGEAPAWGSEGDISQVAQLAAGPLDFYYRPHLFPGMDPALRLGHLLQFDLLPRRLPAGSPLRVAAVLESYCHLSGDLLGWRMEGDELLLWIADVSGHGVRAGLAAAVLYFLVDAIEPGLPPAELARRVSERMLAARNADDRQALYATAFWLRVDASGRGVYASSGHPPMLLRRAAGALERLASNGPPAGLLPQMTFRQAELRLEPGDSLCLFTDGLIEAHEAEEEKRRRRQLVEILSGHSGTALDVTRAIYRAIRETRDTSMLDDDLTFMVVEPAPGTG